MDHLAQCSACGGSLVVRRGCNRIIAVWILSEILLLILLVVTAGIAVWNLWIGLPLVCIVLFAVVSAEASKPKRFS
jgi:hypothetical protein